MTHLHHTLVLALVLLLGIGGGLQSAHAEGGQRFFTPRLSLGIIFLGSSLALTKQGFDFRNEADDFYTRYKKADSSEEAARLYSRTNNRDIKSQVSWALATAFAVSGARILLSGKDGASLSEERGFQPAVTPGFSLEPQLEKRHFGLSLKRRFF